MPRRRTDVPQEYAEYECNVAKLIGDRIKQRRRQLGLGQVKLREKLELSSVSITKTQFSRIENGQLLPSALEVIALAEALEVSFNWLLLGEE